MQNQTVTAHVISHTHWDREWYQTFDEFRINLVDLIDTLLDILDREKEYKFFLLDGQTVILEDYLEIRPGAEERLKRHIRKGRILIGPWYVLSDEFLASGEALIRNLLLGHQIAKRFGGIMKVGYLPDTFGHISQMPQILKGFGIDSAVIWRGLGGKPGELKSEFLWRSPDGTRVLTIHLQDKMGYANAWNISSCKNFDELHEKIALLKKDRVAYATTKHLLFMNGCDHLLPDPKVIEIIKNVNREMAGTVFVHSNLPDYISQIRRSKPRLAIRAGEFRSTKNTSIYAGVLSTRMYIKQINGRLQNKLQNWAEPFMAINWMLGNKYPGHLLRQAWKYILQNHAHDSICG
ncbi:MAG: alpha-mannosidase, partial [Kiritimatiellia bacterium]|nr:alpha-mannosidase [Kiritimatiellia bacterium]